MDIRIIEFIVFFVMTTRCYCQLQYPVIPQYLLPVGYIDEEPETYPRRRYVSIYDTPKYVQRWKDSSVNDYVYQDYNEDDYNTEEEDETNLLIKYLNAHKRFRGPIQMNQRVEKVDFNSITTEIPSPSTPTTTEGQKEIAMFRTQDERRMKPAWFPSLDKLPRVKGRDQKSQSNGEDLTLQLDKLKKPKD
ncbi:uncharacterized protein LOC111627846 [Centruroides sculpturatus]|uniref:uncharacterized protein LOC111627846 n=1 Tax=Centruroides sculpturatus TaxID=218467 RepID=UPI000C6E47AF|nr:uncharacterized protein LOC111627846 [Centruroides sculpturatus]XP_023227273.1 uncharacterized protein LOC111627846 [Centruroides sculpturatus]